MLLKDLRKLVYKGVYVKLNILREDMSDNYDETDIVQLCNILDDYNSYTVDCINPTFFKSGRGVTPYLSLYLSKEKD